MAHQSSDNAAEVDAQTDRPPTYLELESVKTLREAKRITTLSIDTLMIPRSNRTAVAEA
jgi:hypothetical protein